TGEIEMLVAVNAKLLERFLAIAKGIEVRSIHGNASAKARQFFEDKKETVRILKRQRPQQHTVHDREDRRVCPDSEGQGSHGDQRYAPGFDQHPDRVSQILP